MKTKTYDAFKETIHHFTIKKRLTAMVIDKPGYHKTYVTLSTPIGSIHQGYIDANGTARAVPAGIAHFLEHKVFEQEGADISRLFSLNEAQVNAYTEHTRTTYLFSATNHVLENTVRLINMVCHPRFTAEGVKKEKNIIKEELNMQLDNPYHIQYKALLEAMFEFHPVKADILGTAESIEAITLEDLRAMHEAYYQPEQCVLVMIGDLDASAFATALEKAIELPEKTTLKPLTMMINEPRYSLKPHASIPLDILVPNVLFGIKTMPKTDDTVTARLRNQMAFSMFLDMIFGRTGDLYERWLSEGLINDAYGLEVSLEQSFGYALIGTESDKPEAFEAAFLAVIEQITTLEINVADFERTKKQMLGSFVMSLDSLENLAHESAKCATEGIIVYDMLDLAKSITLEDVKNQAHTITNTMVTGVTILPIKKPL